jgi:hypothetical protein
MADPAVADGVTGTPIDQLTRAVKAVTAKGFTYQATTPRGTIEGAIDIPNGASKVRLVTWVEGSDIAVDLLILKSDYYLKVKGIAVADAEVGAYMHVQADKLESEELFGINLLDPSNTKNLADQLVSVERRDDGRFGGTLDLTRGSAFGATRRIVDQMGEAARTVPFEAGVDPGGRLATLTYTLPRYTLAPGFTAPTIEVSVTYADFGSPVIVQKPSAANVVEAPATLYDEIAPAGADAHGGRG